MALINAKISATTVYIIDDHPLWCALLVEILNNTDEFKVVGTAAEAVTGLDFLKENAVDLLLVDLALPGMSGIEFLDTLGQKKSKTKVVVFSGLGSTEAIAAAIIRGADAYIEKTADVAELLNTLHEVMQGRFPLNARVSDVVREIVHKSTRLRQLTGQDIQVFRLLANHMTPKEIAENLGVSTSGIYKAQQKIYTHLGVTNPANLAEIAATYGLVPISLESTLGENPPSAKADASKPAPMHPIL